MGEDMRIVLIGQAAFGENVLKALVERGHKIVGAFCPPEKEGKPSDPVRAAAEEHGIPVFQFKRMRDKEAIDAFLGLSPDLGVMAFVTDIVPDEILNAPAKGTIQYHPSLLPKHRGPSSINWPIIQGESKTGLTIFWPDKGIDTGPILLQKEVEIEPDDTLGTVYFNKLFPLGVDAMVEAVEKVANGTAPRSEQDESKATYEGWCRAQDVIIDWSKPVGDIYNLIRGSDPSPGAGTTYNGANVRVYKAKPVDGPAEGQPGEVVSISDDGILIAARNGALLIGRVQPEKSKKLPASEWSSGVALKPGDYFGNS